MRTSFVNTSLEILIGSKSSQVHKFMRLINHQMLTVLPIWGMAAMRELPTNTRRKHDKTVRSNAWLGELHCCLVAGTKPWGGFVSSFSVGKTS
jgi:hypothetical protein